jgi:hypothetical protein
LTSADSNQPTKDEALLTSVAESIGATLGAIASKANAVTTAIRKPRHAKKSSAKKKKSAKGAKKKSAVKKKPAAKRAKAKSKRR